MSEAYAGKQFVGMDVHRRRSVVVRMTEAGEHLEAVRISNDPEYLRAVMARAGEAHEHQTRLIHACCQQSHNRPHGNSPEPLQPASLPSQLA